MEAGNTFKTIFIHNNTEGEDLYIYRIPECYLPRLHKGDKLVLHKYLRGYPHNNLETWCVEVVYDPEFVISWSDPPEEHKGAYAYDADSVFTEQVVKVKVVYHKWE